MTIENKTDKLVELLESMELNISLNDDTIEITDGITDFCISAYVNENGDYIAHTTHYKYIDDDTHNYGVANLATIKTLKGVFGYMNRHLELSPSIAIMTFKQFKESLNTSTGVDGYDNETTCDTCNTVVTGGYYVDNSAILCEACHTEKYPNDKSWYIRMLSYESDYTDNELSAMTVKELELLAESETSDYCYYTEIETYEYDELDEKAQKKVCSEVVKYLDNGKSSENIEGWESDDINNVVSEARNAIYTASGTFVEIVR